MVSGFSKRIMVEGGGEVVCAALAFLGLAALTAKSSAP